MLLYKNRPAGFTLVETMISSFILIMVVGITMTCFFGLLKQRALAQAATDISLDLQQATRRISNTVASSPTAPLVFTDSLATTPAGVTNNTISGCSIRIAPAKNHYIMVIGGTDIIDAATNTLGYRRTRTSLTLSTQDPQATTRELLREGATCPSASVTTLSSSIFVTTAPTIVPSDYFGVNDVVTLPQTGYGGPTQLTVQSVGSSSVTFTTVLNATSGWALPNGTLIASTSASWSRFAVITTAAGRLKPGDLVYYPDDTDATTMAKYTVLAHDIVHTLSGSRIDPSNAASGTDDYPFTYNTQTQELVVNLQCLPKGNPVSGRAIIGTRSRILIRTSPDQRNI